MENINTPTAPHAPSFDLLKSTVTSLPVRVVWFDEDDMIIGDKVCRTLSAFGLTLRRIPSTSYYNISQVAR